MNRISRCATSAPLITSIARSIRSSASSSMPQLSRQTNSPLVKLDKLETLLRRRTTSLEEVVPLFAALLSIPTDGRCPPPDPDPQRRKERTLNALIDQLAGLAQAGPVLMILEDVHWADPTTLEFLGRTFFGFRRCASS